jgi:hypothetical protein
VFFYSIKKINRAPCNLLIGARLLVRFLGTVQSAGEGTGASSIFGAAFLLFQIAQPTAKVE